jgi:hypothetical protein
VELSKNNITQMMSDNEDEKNDKIAKENESKQTEEKIESESIPDKNTVK